MQKYYNWAKSTTFQLFDLEGKEASFNLAFQQWTTVDHECMNEVPWLLVNEIL